MPKGVLNKRYTPEFHKQVVETMYREKLSIREVSIQFEIDDHKASAKGSAFNRDTDACVRRMAKAIFGHIVRAFFDKSMYHFNDDCLLCNVL